MREAFLQDRHEEAQHHPRRVCIVLMGCWAGCVFLALSITWMPDSLNLQSRVEHAPEFVGSWDRTVRAARDHMHDLFFTIRQNNQLLLEQMIHDMANPESPNFRKWLTKEQVDKITRNDESIHALREALHGTGAIVKAEIGGHLLHARAPVIVWENLLKAEFYMYRHRADGRTRIRANSFTIPVHMHKHVDAILGILDLDHSPTKLSSDIGDVGVSRSSFINHSAVHVGQAVPAELAYLSQRYVTPLVLRDAYNLPDPESLGQTQSLIDGATTQAVFSSHVQYWSPEDQHFFTERFKLPAGIVDHLATSYAYNVTEASSSKCGERAGNCMEANLDMQYMHAMSPWSKTGIFFQKSPKHVFTDMVVGLAAMQTPPHVMSISYGMPEPAQSKSLLTTFDSVACKLAAQGVTLLAASGDDGANAFARVSDDCKHGLSVSWPASSPWVTAVGATMGIESGSPEIACSTDAKGPTANASIYQPVITSGGGYSQHVARPYWQDAALPDDRKFRGIPDVSLAGHAYVVRNGGKWVPVDGTRASSPAFAGMISILNAHLNNRDSEDGNSRALRSEDSGDCQIDTGMGCTVFPCPLKIGPTKCVRHSLLTYRCECPDGYCVVDGVCTPKSAYTCQTDTGGTCLALPCKKDHGPTECAPYTLNYKCICTTGYCAINGVCQRTSNPDRKKSVGWLNPLLYKNAHAFRDITEGSNRCASKGRPCCGGYDAKKGWDPVTGLGAIEFRELARSLHVDL